MPYMHSLLPSFRAVGFLKQNGVLSLCGVNEENDI